MVAITPVAVESGRVVRRWPPQLEAAVRQLFEDEDGAEADLFAWLG